MLPLLRASLIPDYLSGEKNFAQNRKKLRFFGPFSAEQFRPMRIDLPYMWLFWLKKGGHPPPVGVRIAFVPRCFVLTILRKRESRSRGDPIQTSELFNNSEV